MNSNYPTLHLRSVPTTDWITLTYHPKSRQNDIIAIDKNGNEIARWPWFYDSKPKRRNKYVMFNCCKYLAKWD